MTDDAFFRLFERYLAVLLVAMIALLLLAAIAMAVRLVLVLA